jgi:hypothetical protein
VKGKIQTKITILLSQATVSLALLKWNVSDIKDLDMAMDKKVG